MQPLPIDPHLPRLVEVVRRRRAAVVVAPPGSGKTTRVPPALLALGKVLVLEPRRLAARSLAARIASEQGFRVGEEVGWQVRFEKRFSSRTRLLVATEGVLTARLVADPLLADFQVVVLDEFHERSLVGDLALALSRQAARARDDLAIVVMSATLDAEPVARFLDGAEVVEVEGRPYPVTIEHAEVTPAAGVRRAVAAPGSGHVLCFLPGAGEIARLAEDLRDVPARVLPLHGSLPSELQDEALAPSHERKVVLATNVAETSLTVEGVTHVVDSGLARVLRFDPATGLDRLVTERISADSAVQRAGRAGRTGPGHALRLWSPSTTLAPRREPEIRRVDLSVPFLEVLAWGADPLTFEWFEAPDPERAEAALALLRMLGAVDGRRLTRLGEVLRRFPLHPRLARVVVEAGGHPLAARACALLAERDFLRGDTATTSCDLLPRLDALGTAPQSVRRAAREIEDLARRLLDDEAASDDAHAADSDEDRLRRALLAGFPDRVARRRAAGSPRLLLASGAGAILAPESGVREAAWLVALDLVAAPRSAADRAARPDARVRLASAIEVEWLSAIEREVVHRFDAESGQVRAVELTRYGALVLAERTLAPDPAEAERLLVEALRERPMPEEDLETVRRLRFAGLEVDADALRAAACVGRTSLPEEPLLALLPPRVRAELDRLAPPALDVPSGRRHALTYREDGAVVLAVKLQELFGLAETPRVGPRREPVLLELLSPARRPVQATRDLRSFWERTYPEVRKELRARYPRHPWPEDPFSAPPTARAKPRGT